MFVSGNKNLLLKLLGLGYGKIVFEGYEPIIVITVEVGDQLLKEAAEQGLINEDGAAQIKQQMADINMAANLGQLTSMIDEYTAHEGFEPSYKFAAHEDCPHPLPHGIVVDKDNKPLCHPIHHLEDGLSLVLEMAESEQYHVLDCINVFKQMLAMNLPVDEAAVRQQLNEELLKEGVDESLVPHLDTMADMLAAALGLKVTIVEIKLPRGVSKPSDKTNTGMPGQPPSSPQA